jgi:hypothetical protein
MWRGSRLQRHSWGCKYRGYDSRGPAAVLAQVDRMSGGMFPDPSASPQQLRQWLQAEVRRVAAIIRQLEQETPGYFGEAAAVIRQQAAGDDVAPDDLLVALVSVRLTLREATAFQERNTAPVERRSAEDELTAWSVGEALKRVWRALIYWRGRS